MISREIMWDHSGQYPVQCLENILPAMEQSDWSTELTQSCTKRELLPVVTRLEHRQCKQVGDKNQSRENSRLHCSSLIDTVIIGNMFVKPRMTYVTRLACPFFTIQIN